MPGGCGFAVGSRARARLRILMLTRAVHGRPRPWRRRVSAVLLFIAGVVLLTSGPASGSAPCDPDDEHVKVLKVDGRLDAVMVDFVTSEVNDLEGSCALALLLQLNSAGSVDDRAAFDEMIEAIERTDKPIEVWVGPSGSRAAGEATEVLAVSDRVGVAAPKSRVEVTPELVEARGLSPEDLGAAREGDRVPAERAVELGLVDSDAPTVGHFATEMDMVETEADDDGNQVPTTPIVSAELPLLGQLMHTVASEPVAYLLFVIGLALLIFELYSAGIGIAGMVGAGCLVLACYGFNSLPTNPIGVGLLLFAMFGYAVDAQTGIPRAWTAIGTVAFIGGSLWLFDGHRLSWITLAPTFIGMTVFMLRGMPIMVRSRFSTSTIDRQGLLGEIGTAASEIRAGSSGGVVTLRDAPWTAVINDDASIASGERVEVVGTDGYRLTVESVESLPRGAQSGE